MLLSMLFSLASWNRFARFPLFYFVLRADRKQGSWAISSKLLRQDIGMH